MNSGSNNNIPNNNIPIPRNFDSDPSVPSVPIGEIHTGTTYRQSPVQPSGTTPVQPSGTSVQPYGTPLRAYDTHANVTPNDYPNANDYNKSGGKKRFRKSRRKSRRSRRSRISRKSRK